MGAWGTGIFEDDSTVDFLYDIIEHEAPMTEFDDVFTFSEKGDYLEYDDGTASLASAAILANWHSDYEIDTLAATGLEEWLAKNKQPVSEELRKRAVQAVRRVLGHESELCELWADSVEYASWRKGLKEVIVSLEK